MIHDRYPGRTIEDINRELEALENTPPDDGVRAVRDDVSRLRIRIPPTPQEEDATVSAIVAGLSAISLANKIPAAPQNTPIDYVAELEQRMNRHRTETPAATPSAITIEWTEAADALLFARNIVDPIVLDHIAEVLTRPELMTAAVPLPVSAAPPVPPQTPVSTPVPAMPPPVPLNESVQTLPEPAQTPITVQPGFEERLAKAKAKFELLQALRRRAEQSIDTLEISVKKNKRFKKVKRGRITAADLNKHYESTIFKANAAEVEKQKSAREARATRRALNNQGPQTRRAKIVPEEAVEIAGIEKNLTDAETLVKDYKNQLEATRTEFPDEVAQEGWNADIDKRLELEFDYLLQVERTLATVPPALRLAPPPAPTDTLKKADDAIAYATASMQRAKASRDRLQSIASTGQVMPPPPWKPGGGRTKKRKPRTSTFRRNRKH